MKKREHSITVRVSKTIQEKEFEPFNVQFTDTVVFDEIENPKKERLKLYTELKNQLRRVLKKR